MICSDLDAKGKARPAGVLIVVVGVEVTRHREKSPAGAFSNTPGKSMFQAPAHVLVLFEPASAFNLVAL
jgi:hypothetical protein